MGYASVLAGNAAEAAALALAGGGDPEAAARRPCPAGRGKRLEVAVKGGEVRVAPAAAASSSHRWPASWR